MNNAIEGELWLPRTMWEKRRQLSAVIHRSISIGRKMLILSCDDWTTFFGRIDVGSDFSNHALTSGQIEYMQVTPLSGVSGGGAGGTDLSRILGQIGIRYKDQVLDQIVVDDVDMMIDLSSGHETMASLFALIYALKARCHEMIFFSNPVRDERQIQYLMQMQDHLVVHAHTPSQQSAA